MISDPCLDCQALPPEHHTVATHNEYGCVIAGCECKTPYGRYINQSSMLEAKRTTVVRQRNEPNHLPTHPEA
jgi:hypothetical protein